MHHDTPLIGTIAVGLAFAFVGGLTATRVGLPPLVGYLLAGIAVGPFTPGFVADAKLAPQLAEIGVILLMFGVGMHFSIRDLWNVRKIALPGAIGQIAAATLMGALLARFWGWSWGAGLILGLSLSVASTVVLLRALESHGIVNTDNGRIAVGWLIVEDLVMVLALVLLPAFSGLLGGKEDPHHPKDDIPTQLAWTFIKLVAFMSIMIVIGRRAFPVALRVVERTGSRELFTLAIIASAMGVAYASAEFFGVSFALGAFFAGIVLHESELSHRATLELNPLQDMFAALFFVAVGMLFNPAFLTEKPLQIVAVVAIIIVGKSIIALAVVLSLGKPLATALTVSAALAQIGEFSFILAALGLQLEILPAEGQNLLVAGALVSITLNPFLFRLSQHGISRD